MDTVSTIDRGAPKAQQTPYTGSIRPEAKQLIANCTTKASAVAAIPITGVDTVGLIIIQTQMLSNIRSVYDCDKADLSELIFPSIISACVAGLIHELISSLDEQWPLSSLFPRSVVQAAIAGLLTQSTGELYALHLQSPTADQPLTISDIINYIRAQWQSDRYATDQLVTSLVDHITNRYL